MLHEYVKYLSPKDDIDTDGGSELSTDNVEKVLIKDSEGNEIEVEFEEDEHGNLIPTLPEDTSDEDFENLSKDTKFQAEIKTAAKTLGKVKKDRMEQKQEMTKFEHEKAQLAQEKAEFEAQKLAFARQQQGGLSDSDAKKYWGVDTVAEIEDLPKSLQIKGQADYTSDVMLEKMKTAMPQPKPEIVERTVADITRKPPKTIDGNVQGGGKGKQKREVEKVGSFG